MFEGNFPYVTLVDGGNFVVELAERVHFQIALEGVSVECYFVEIARSYEFFDAASVFAQLASDAAELIIRHFKHSGKAAEIAKIDLRNFYAGFVAGVVIHIGPGVLQDGAHLDFETDFVELWTLGVEEGALVDGADVVEGEVAETVYSVIFAFIYGVFPIDIKESFDDGGYFVYVVYVEGYDSDSYDVGYVVDAVVFAAFEFKFSFQGFFAFDSLFDCGYCDACLSEDTVELLGEHCSHLPVQVHICPVFLKNSLGVVHIAFAFALGWLAALPLVVFLPLAACWRHLSIKDVYAILQLNLDSAKKCLSL